MPAAGEPRAQTCANVCWTFEGRSHDCARLLRIVAMTRRVVREMLAPDTSATTEHAWRRDVVLTHKTSNFEAENRRSSIKAMRLYPAVQMLRYRASSDALVPSIRGIRRYRAELFYELCGCSTVNRRERCLLVGRRVRKESTYERRCPQGEMAPAEGRR